MILWKLIGKNQARLFKEKKQGSKKIKRLKEHRDAAEIKYIRYCEYIYSNQVQNSTDALLEKWNLPKWLCRNNTLNRKNIINKSYPENYGFTIL